MSGSYNNIFSQYEKKEIKISILSYKKPKK